MSIPLQAACCLCWDTVGSTAPVSSAWQRDGISLWASPHKSTLKRESREKVRLLRWKDYSPAFFLPSASLFNTLPESWLVSFPLSRIKPAGIKKQCFFRHKSFFLLPASFAFIAVCGTDICNQFCVLSKRLLVWGLVPICLTPLLFGKDLKLLLQCSLHLWLSSLKE